MSDLISVSSKPYNSTALRKSTIGKDYRPGISLSVLKNGRIESAACGSREPGGWPARATDAVRLASVTKMFTATLALILVEEGSLSLSEPIHDVAGVRLPGVTLAQCLGHRTRLPEPIRQEIIGLWMNGQRNSRWSRKEPLGTAVDTPKFETERGEFLCDDAGFVIAALMIERATGLTFHRALRRYILTPLSLDSMWLEPQEAAKRPAISPFVLGRDATQFDLSPGWGGGLCGSPGDMLRFMFSLVSGQLLGPETYARMIEFHPVPQQNGKTRYDGYGLGVGMRELGGRRLIGHMGELGSFLWWIEGTGAFLSGSVNRMSFTARERLIDDGLTWLAREGIC